MALPPKLQLALRDHLARFDSEAIRRARERLTARYEAGVAAAFADDAEVAAYLAARLPATFEAMHAALSEAWSRCESLHGVRTQLDIGAGPGSAAWAAREVFPELEDTTLIERDARIASAGAAIATGMPWKWRAEDVTGSVAWPRADLATACYVGNELDAAELPRLAERLWAAAALGVVIVEPGTPRGFEAVRAMRARLIELGATIAAPCPHADACPMAGDRWCHFAARVERSASHRRAKDADAGWEDEKFSYVIAVRETARAATARIIDRPRIATDHVALRLCTRDGLVDTQLRKNDRDAMRRARKASWGDAWEGS